MKSSKVISYFISMIIITLVLLPNNIYSMQKNEKIPDEVIIGGELLHIELNTNKVMIFGVNQESKLKDYDLVESVEGSIVKKVFNKENMKIKSKQELIKLHISMKDNDEIIMNVNRNNNFVKLKLNKNELRYNNLIDKIPYTATLTYINPKSRSFKAVGHSIEFDKNNVKLKNEGDIFYSNILKLEKSKKKYVGNITGDKNSKSKGEITNIDRYGISGHINEKKSINRTYKIADEKDIKLGEAYVVMKHNCDEKKIHYKINVSKINKDKDNNIKNFNFKIVDKRLISNYGGIVQGMSGSPIIQNNKIIGALSHVITTDTTNGVGVYIKIMMKE